MMIIYSNGMSWLILPSISRSTLVQLLPPWLQRRCWRTAQAVRQNGTALQHAGDELQADPELLKEAAKRCHDVQVMVKSLDNDTNVDHQSLNNIG